jgi:uncharacterized protein YycO
LKCRFEWIVISGIVLGFIGIILCPSRFVQESRTLVLLQSTMRALIKGNITGTYQGHPNHADFGLLEPGDILVCHNRNCGYGYWTHVALYVGNGQVVESSNFTFGTHLNQVNKFHFYDEIGILRVNTNKEIKNRVIKRAFQEIGKPYDIFSSINDVSSEYCSKLIWNVYFHEGIVLCKPEPWILPDDLAKSRQTKWIGIWNE